MSDTLYPSDYGTQNHYTSIMLHDTVSGDWLFFHKMNLLPYLCNGLLYFDWVLTLMMDFPFFPVTVYFVIDIPF